MKGCEQNIKKSVEYFTKGCQLDDNEGCFYAGQLLSGSDPLYRPSVEPNIKKALEYLEKGCDNTKNGIISGECCFYAHSHYLLGKNGCEKDLAKAFKLAEKGCEFDNFQSCNNLSQMYGLGSGTPKNEEMAQKYRRKTLDVLEELENQRQIEMSRK